MSEILHLAEAFRQKSEKQAESIGQEVANEYKQHAEIIRQCLEESVSTLQGDIAGIMQSLKSDLAQQADSLREGLQDSNQRLKRSALSGWLWLTLTMVLLFAASAGALLLSGSWIAENARTLAEQKAQSAELLAPKGLRVWRDGDRVALELPKGWESQPPVKSKNGSQMIFLGTPKALEKR